MKGGVTVAALGGKNTEKLNKPLPEFLTKHLLLHLPPSVAGRQVHEKGGLEGVKVTKIKTAYFFYFPS